ncbi:winged helix-turn-helix domain-containing protein [Serratia marcescens]
MLFLINDSILYNENEGTISSLGAKATPIKLLNPTRRMLSIFVRNNQILISRSKIMNDVWSEYGLVASNNNLNNYISILRRTLDSFGAEGIIVTQPRIGFRFTAKKVEVKKSSDIDDNTNIFNTHSNVDIKETKHDTKIYKGSNFSKVKTTYLIASIGVIIYVLLSYFLKESNNTIGFAIKGNYEECSVYSANEIAIDAHYINNLIRQAGFDCKEKANVLFYYKIANENSIKEDQDRQVLTFCPIDQRIPCTYYYFTRK